MLKLRDLTAPALLVSACVSANATEAIYIDAGTRGHAISESMYGIFFEEINHSGDGGLYAELLQNRGFEEHVLPGGFSDIGGGKIATATTPNYLDLVPRRLEWDWDYGRKKMAGWRVESRSCCAAYDVVTPGSVLHAATPHALRLTISSSAGSGSAVELINDGYWGISVTEGEKYDLRFHLNTSDYSGKVRAVVYADPDGREIVAESVMDVDRGGAWHEYRAELTAGKSVKSGRFALEFSGDGEIYVDYVSLFPQDTYMGRSNGLRKDLAEFLVALKPSFMRWPGGCIVEGITLDNRVKWKETIGDPMTRRGEYDLWGYRSTWGLGYHEMLQFCEDAGMDFMFVGNAGMACTTKTGEFVSGEALEPYYEDIRDAIEYAIGDPATNEWAALRAEAGHPEPFPLKYVEIGNENFSARYDANYKYIYNKLKAEYPDLTFLNTMGIDDAESFNVRTDMIDPHWYVDPNFFYSNRKIFDNVPRGHYDIYVGEYAANNGVGRGNMDAALSEAVFMMDMERNSDIVKMSSYAPLITNDNAPNWTCNLIWQHSGELFGRASYYTQKMFSENLPSYNMVSALHSDRLSTPYEGRAGVGTWLTAADFRNFKVTSPDGTVLYNADFAGNFDEWTPMQGRWAAAADGTVNQSDAGSTRCIALMNRLAFRDCVIEVEARKNSGSEGFLLTFGCDDDDWDHYYQFNVGGWGNTAAAIESVSGGGGTVISDKPEFRVQTGQWYKLKVVCHEGSVEGYVDGKLICRYEFGDERTGRAAVHAGYDEKRGEIVVKVVNAEAEPLSTSLILNASELASTATVQTLKAASLWEENSFEYPELISPQETTVGGVSKVMDYTFEPYSLTVVRIKGRPAASPMSIPAQPYSSEPRALNPVKEGPDEMLRAMVEEARKVMFDDIEGHAELSGAVASAENLLESGDPDLIKAEIPKLEQALNRYYKSVITVSEDMTDRLVNPHFEQSGRSEGWSGHPTVGDHVAEVFNTCFNVSQTVAGLPDGYYLVYFQGYYRNGTHPDASSRHADGTERLLTQFSLNGFAKPVVSLMSESHDGYWYGAPNTMAEAAAVFGQSADNYANYLIVPVDGGSLRIGFEKGKLCESDWFCFDNVRLYRVATSHSSIETVEPESVQFSPDAEVYDLQGRSLGRYSGAGCLSPGVYIVVEKGRSAKVIF